MLKYLLRKRNKLLRKGLIAEAEIIADKIPQLIKENQQNMVQTSNRKYQRGSKAWWELVDKLSGRSKPIKHLSALFNVCDMNDHFKAINTDLDYTEPRLVEITDSCQPPTFDEVSVMNALTRLKRTATGPDNIPFWLWKEFAPELTPALTHIFNISVVTQKIPKRWKTANVRPIPKETNMSTLNQLRPISVTDVIMRIFERLVLTSYLKKPVVAHVDTNQYAYREKCSTEMALLYNQHFWMKCLDSSADFIRVFSFDFSKAFDYVSHNVVSEKLKIVPGINHYVINWVIDFLKDRSQRVCVDNICSDCVSINRGVPQGTVIGPVLFTIMVDDIEPVPTSTLMIKYADDITCSIPVIPTDANSSNAVDEVENIKVWAE